jgi:hypothetical protein
VLALLACARAARADDAAAATASVPASETAPRAPSLERVRRIDRTAYTLDPLQVGVGVESVEFAPLAELTLGTYVPTWVLSPVLGTPVPTAFVKARTPFSGPVLASVRVNLVYLNATSLHSELAQATTVNGSLWIVPIELALSADISQRLSESLELMYLAIRGSANADGTATIRGSAAADGVTLSSFSELRMSRSFSLTLLARVLVHADAARVQGSSSSNGTNLDFNLGVRRRNAFVACVVPGVELDLGRAHLDLGLGYGSWWLPIVELPLASYGLVPEANAFVRF